MGYCENSFATHPSVLQTIEQIQSTRNYLPTLPPYIPSKAAWIFVDRSNPKQLFTLNLIIPPAWKSLPSVGAALSVQAPQDIPLPLNRNYESIFRAGPNATPLSEVLVSNPLLSGLFVEFAPYFDVTQSDIKIPGGLTYTALHEGFHHNAQFSKSSWAWNLDDLKMPRSDSAVCIDSKNTFISKEYTALGNVWDQLAAGATPTTLKKTWRTWNDARELRIANIPEVVHPGNTPTNCRNMDRMYHRVEGLADYAAFSTLAQLKTVKIDEVRDFYRKVILDHPSETPALEFGFYASGSAYAFLLERINPSGEWKTRVIEDSQSSLAELTAEYMNLIP